MPSHEIKWSRRRWLKTAGVSLTAFLIPTAIEKRSRALAEGKTLIALYLRGAADGLNLVVPYGDPDYYAIRPGIQVAPGEELDLDGFFGFHPTLAPLLPAFAAGDLAIVHAAGSPSSQRSHFVAQDYMERAAPDQPGVSTGWLARFLNAAGVTDPHAGMTIGSASVPALLGTAAAVAVPSIGSFNLTGRNAVARRAALEAMYGAADDPLLSNGVASTFSTVDVVSGVPDMATVDYPAGGIGAALRDAANMIKADIGVRAIAINLGGWDHHSNEVNALNATAPGLSNGLAAFYDDLDADALSRTVLLAMTEFGRTARENGSGGTDHGHGSIMLALGGSVLGGQVLTGSGWPGLRDQDLFQGRDLEVTVDFRNVFAEAVDHHMELADLTSVFPEFAVNASNYPGILG